MANPKAVQATRADEAFLAEYDPDQFPRPSVTVDVVLLTVSDGKLGALVHQRPAAPFAGTWALPGGFLGTDEELDAAAARVLRQKAGVRDVWLEQLYTFGAPGRDPRTRVLSVAYVALVHESRFPAAAAGAAASGADGPVTAVAYLAVDHGEPAQQVAVAGKRVKLAFDHLEIVRTAATRIGGKLDWTNVAFQLLPDEFTLRELQHVHEVILGRELTATNFARRVRTSGQVQETGRREQSVDHRPAKLYRFVAPGS